MQSPLLSPARRALNGIVAFISPGRSRDSLHRDTDPSSSDITPELGDATQCASGDYCYTPIHPVGKSHKCKTCQSFMHIWCRGLVEGGGEYTGEESCMRCSDGFPHPDNAGFQCVQDYVREKGASLSSRSDEVGEFEETRDDSDSDSDDGEELGLGDDDDDEKKNMKEYNNTNFEDWVIHDLKWQDITLDLASESLNDMKDLLMKSVKILKREVKTKRACQHFARDLPCNESRNR